MSSNVYPTDGPEVDWKIGDLVRPTPMGKAYYAGDGKDSIRGGMVLGVIVGFSNSRYDDNPPVPFVEVIEGACPGEQDGWAPRGLMPALEVPKFTSIEEADAWLETHSPKETA